jgi:HD-GYP domain-containing protein (c-di-GMP phosphodiesterase class II)
MASDFKVLKDIISLDSELNKIQDQDILLERILLEARKVVNADAGSIYVRRGDELVISYAQNDTKQKNQPPGHKLIYSIFTVPINKKSISGYSAATGEPVNIKDAYNIPKKAPYAHNTYYDKVSGYKTESILTIPLKTNTGDILGVIQLINAKDTKGNIIPFNKNDELVALHFATNAAVALQRAQMTRAILLRMISMAELRDPKETGTHVNRVAGYSVEIYERWAHKVGIPPREIEKTRDVFRMASMLHDVGKVAISDVILKKPGRLTDEEFETMKIHTWCGARLFTNKQSEFDEVAQMVAATHHEDWDGNGYPGHVDYETGKPLKTDSSGNIIGKRGREIPVFGRIVAIADVYDALRSKRVYKEAWTEEAALAEMKRLSGTKFDPELMEVFFAILPNIRAISDKYSEIDRSE